MTGGFRDYLKAEVEAIGKFCEEVQREKGHGACPYPDKQAAGCRDCPEGNAIALLWVNTGRAAQFRRLHQEQLECTNRMRAKKR